MKLTGWTLSYIYLVNFLIFQLLYLYFLQRLLDRDAAEAGSSIVYPEVKMMDHVFLIWSAQEIRCEPKHKKDGVSPVNNRPSNDKLHQKKL